MNVQTNKSIKSQTIKWGEEMNKELIRLLDYWASNGLDSIYGGFVGRIDHFGNKEEKAIKGIVLNSRILWTFSSAFRVTQHKRYKQIADIAYEYLMKHFWDKDAGGFFWSVDYKGHVENDRKQTYAQGFGIYGLSEYNRATGNQEALAYAKQLYSLVEDKFWDKKFGGYIEALNVDWLPLQDMRLSLKDANLPKSMNTHLHILESYTCLYRVWPNEQLKASIKSLISIFQDKIIDAHTGHYNLFFEKDWSVKSSAISFGHDIEGAWLMHEAAEVIGDKTIIKNVQKAALNLVNITLNEGIDKDGSLFNEKEGDHLDTDKHWWPQAEAMVGLFDAWQIEGNIDYLNAIEKLWSFIKDKLIDKVNGEWYWRVDINGVANQEEDKVGFWKCPYHNSRALMEITERLEKYKK